MCKISIIVPVYNSSEYLERCLDSLMGQTLEDIEIIVVNDGSTDCSESIIKKYQKRDKRIKLINKENGGQSSARNLGLNNAKGEYISFVDSDDYIDINLCKDTFQVAKKEKCDIVVFDSYITDSLTNNYSKVLNDFSSGQIDCKDFFFAGVGPCNKIYRRSFLQKNHFSFPLNIIYEDYAAIIPLAKYNPQVYYLNKAYYYYFQSPESTMRKKEYNVKYEDIFAANDILLNSLKDSSYHDELEYIICYHMLYLGSLNFYEYHKLDQIDRIAIFIKNNFPLWYKNQYFLDFPKKKKILMWLFYLKKYKIIKLWQSIKRCFK